MLKSTRTHFTRGSKKVLCGLRSKATRKDTRIKAKVTCGNCKRVLAAEDKD